MSRIPRETWVKPWLQPEPELHFSEELQKSNVHTRRAPYRILPKDKSLGVDSAAFNAVLRVYPNAIEIGTVRGGFAGNKSETRFWSILVGAFLAANITILIMFLFGGFVVGSVIISSFSYFIFCVLIKLVNPRCADDPVIVNRKMRLVHVLPYVRGGFFRFWIKASHGPVRTYRWDDQVHGRIYRYTYARGLTLPQIGHELGLLGTRAEAPQEVETLVTLGVQSSIDHAQLSLWEHIRQYMDEDGPPLQPDDRLRERDPAKLPSFPDEVIAEAGGPALDEAGIRRQIDGAVQRRQG